LLQAKFEALKRKLEAEGLFDPPRKRPLPPFPVSIGIVTSPSGAALRDMLNVLERRAPWVHVVVSGVRVQGEGAAEEIAAAIAELNHFAEYDLRPVDVIVVARGGGSAEDLWEFNEEIVARAIAASAIPVVSAIGHEIDFTIADFVADLRAPTPSAAAELVAPDRAELQRRLSQRLGQMQRQLTALCERTRSRLSAATRSALFRGPERRLQAAAQRLDSSIERLGWTLQSNLAAHRERTSALLAVLRQHRPDQRLAIRRQQLQAAQLRLLQSFKHQAAERRRRLTAAVDLLRLVSPLATLKRGYTITTATSGELLRSASEAIPGRRIRTRFVDGEIESEVGQK
jgi:exodeoxyribonuclease VII large subunit